MIICQRPWRVYDVDLIGFGVLLALVVVGFWFVVRPWQAMWSRYQEVARARLQAEVLLGRDLQTLDELQADLARLQNVIVSEADEVPGVDAQPQLLRQLTDLAKACDLDLISVVPRAAETRGVYLVTDIEMGGRGAGRDFICFIDQLAAANPYQALRSCSLARPAKSESGTCDLTCTVRLYLLPRRTTEGGSQG